MATKRPAARKKSVSGGRKKRSKNKPFDSPDFVTITNVDIYVGTVKADSPEHALQVRRAKGGGGATYEATKRCEYPHPF